MSNVFYAVGFVVVAFGFVLWRQGGNLCTPAGIESILTTPPLLGMCRWLTGGLEVP